MTTISDNSGNSESSENAGGIRTAFTYRDEVKRAYELRKNELFEGRINKPTPAGLRNIFRLLVAEGLDAADTRVLQSFLRDDNLERIDVDRFRPLILFMTGKTQNPDVEILNLLAILVAFTPRPLNQFIQRSKPGMEQMETTDEQNEHILNEPAADYEKEKREASVEKSTEPNDRKRNMRLLIWIFAVFTAACIGTYLYYNKPGCMQWNGEQYVRVDCTASDAKNPVYGFDDKQFLVRKVEVSESTPFFENGEPLLWYSKVNGYEFFDHPGHHPVEIEKQLKPVTTAIAKDFRGW